MALRRQVVRIVAADASEDLPLVVDVVVDAIGEVVVVVGLDEALLEVIHAGDVVARLVGRPELLHQRAVSGSKRPMGSCCRRRACAVTAPVAGSSFVVNGS